MVAPSSKTFCLSSYFVREGKMWISLPLVPSSIPLYPYKAILRSACIPLPMTVQTVIHILRHMPLHTCPRHVPVGLKVLDHLLGLFNIRKTGILAIETQASPALAMQHASSLSGTVDGIAPVVLIEEAVQGVFIPCHRVHLMQGQAHRLDGLDLNRPDGNRLGIVLRSPLEPVGITALAGLHPVPPFVPGRRQQCSFCSHGLRVPTARCSPAFLELQGVGTLPPAAPGVPERGSLWRNRRHGRPPWDRPVPAWCVRTPSPSVCSPAPLWPGYGSSCVVPGRSVGCRRVPVARCVLAVAAAHQAVCVVLPGSPARRSERGERPVPAGCPSLSPGRGALQ